MYVEDRVLDIIPTFNPERWATYNGVVDVEAYTIEFSEEDSYHLAGPYHFDGKCYGLVIVTRHDEQRTLAEILRDIEVRNYTNLTSTVWMTPSSVKTIKDFVGKDYSDYYFDKETGISFSDLDLKYGLKELDHQAVGRAKKAFKGGRCAIFWKTKGANSVIISKLTYYENYEAHSRMMAAFESTKRELTITAPTVDRPWRIYLCGNDDASWTMAAESEEKVKEVLEDIKSKGFNYVNDNMAFTN